VNPSKDEKVKKMLSLVGLGNLITVITKQICKSKEQGRKRPNCEYNLLKMHIRFQVFLMIFYYASKNFSFKNLEELML